jgi:hypothetical protein
MREQPQMQSLGTDCHHRLTKLKAEKESKVKANASGTEVAEEPQRSSVKDAEGRLKDSKGFFRHPTAEEVSRLTLGRLRDLGVYAQEARNQFAHLLNRGSSLE